MDVCKPLQYGPSMPILKQTAIQNDLVNFAAAAAAGDGGGGGSGGGSGGGGGGRA